MSPTDATHSSTADANVDDRQPLSRGMLTGTGVETVTASWSVSSVPTYRVTYRPGRGVRRLIEDIEARDLIVETSAYLLVDYQLVILQPREVVALRVPVREVTAIRRVCDLPARWGGVRLP